MKRIAPTQSIERALERRVVGGRSMFRVRTRAVMRNAKRQKGKFI
jgi:hypothetical protein